MGEQSACEPSDTKQLTFSAQGQKYGEERIKANINMTALKHEVCIIPSVLDSSFDVRPDIS